MTKLMKTAGLAGVLAAFLAGTALELRAAESKNGVREGQAVVTELGPNASATTYWVACSDGEALNSFGILAAGTKRSSDLIVTRSDSTSLFPGNANVVSRPLSMVHP